MSVMTGEAFFPDGVQWQGGGCDVVEPVVQPRQAGGLFCGQQGEKGFPALGLHHFLSGRGGSGQRDDAGHVLWPSGGDAEGYGAAHAVSGQTDACGVDFPAAAEVVQRAPGIIGGRLQGGGGMTSSGTSRPAVVHAERGEALPGQGVGDHEERAVVPHLFVPVLCAAAGDEHYGGEGAFSFGQDQCAGQPDAVGGGDADFLLTIRERRLGRARSGCCGDFPCNAFQVEGERLSGLRHRSLDE